MLLSATQILYAGEGHSLDFGSGTCRVCGGLLCYSPELKKSNWSNWTDENLCRDTRSAQTCAGCRWVLENRMQLFSTKDSGGKPRRAKVLLGDLQGNRRYIELEGLLDALKHARPPFVLMVSENGNTKKHLALRLLGAENHSKELVTVVWVSLRDLASTCTVTLNPGSFENDVARLAALDDENYWKVYGKICNDPYGLLAARTAWFVRSKKGE